MELALVQRVAVNTPALYRYVRLLLSVATAQHVDHTCQAWLKQFPSASPVQQDAEPTTETGVETAESPVETAIEQAISECITKDSDEQSETTDLPPRYAVPLIVHTPAEPEPLATQLEKALSSTTADKSTIELIVPSSLVIHRNWRGLYDSLQQATKSASVRVVLRPDEFGSFTLLAQTTLVCLLARCSTIQVMRSRAFGFGTLLFP